MVVNTVVEVGNVVDVEVVGIDDVWEVVGIVVVRIVEVGKVVVESKVVVVLVVVLTVKARSSKSLYVDCKYEHDVIAELYLIIPLTA